jgi:hypothetical protein
LAEVKGAGEYCGAIADVCIVAARVLHVILPWRDEAEVGEAFEGASKYYGPGGEGDAIGDVRE